MKETLFEMLMNLFETTLLRLKEVATSEDAITPAAHEKMSIPSTMPLKNLGKALNDVYHMLIIKEASDKGIRVFTLEEQLKLSKSSYQFLMRLNSWGILSRDVMELIINRLMLSDSYSVSLQETKWIVRGLLADKLSFNQMAYLDLVLYHKEDAIVKH